MVQDFFHQQHGLMFEGEKTKEAITVTIKMPTSPAFSLDVNVFSVQMPFKCLPAVLAPKASAVCRFQRRPFPDPSLDKSP